jgi:3-hydroxyacyl-[acyl-carrier-protein] dehydratase
MTAHELPRPEELLPHRGIALALDEITELEENQATGLWTPDERYFEGHFPEQAFLPGHWQTESVALIGACAMLSKRPDLLLMFRENHGVFKKRITPGQTLEVSAEFGEIVETERSGVKMLTATGKGSAKVDGKLAYQARILKAVASPGGAEE